MDGEPPTSSKRVRVNKSAVHKEFKEISWKCPKTNQVMKGQMPRWRLWSADSWMSVNKYENTSVFSSPWNLPKSHWYVRLLFVQYLAKMWQLEWQEQLFNIPPLVVSKIIFGCCWPRKGGAFDHKTCSCGVLFPSNMMGLRFPAWVLDQSEPCGRRSNFLEKNLLFLISRKIGTLIYMSLVLLNLYFKCCLRGTVMGRMLLCSVNTQKRLPL